MRQSNNFVNLSVTGCVANKANKLVQLHNCPATAAGCRSICTIVRWPVHQFQTLPIITAQHFVIGANIGRRQRGVVSGAQFERNTFFSSSSSNNRHVDNRTMQPIKRENPTANKRKSKRMLMAKLGASFTGRLLKKNWQTSPLKPKIGQLKTENSAQFS